MSLSDKILDEFHKEIISRIKHIDLRNDGDIFPELVMIFPMLKLEHLERLMPNLALKYGKDTLFNIHIKQIVSEDEEIQELFENGNKVEFLKDILETTVAL